MDRQHQIVWYEPILENVMRQSAAEFRVLMALVLGAGALWVFLAVVEAVFLEGSGTIDRAILLAFRTPSDLSRPIGPAWLPELIRDFTALGSYGVLTLVTIATGGFLLLTRRYGSSLYLVLAIVSGTVLVNVLKLVFGRPRPDIVPLVSELHMPSFPSGHAAISAIVYLTITALLARLQPDRRVQAYLIGVGVFLTLLVGVTRIYLAVHWPSDVLGGWALGAAWALIWWATAESLRSKRVPKKGTS